MIVRLREYLLKGIFLGLWAYLVLQQPGDAADWGRLWRVVAFTAGGLAVGVLVGAVLAIRRGGRPGRNPVAFLLTVLLDSPYWIYLGVVGGLLAGLAVEYGGSERAGWLVYSVLGGAVLGVGFYQLQHIRERAWRLGIGLLLAGLLVYAAVHYLDQLFGADLADAGVRTVLGWAVLLGLPFFYLLAFCGETEETEIEFAALCAGLGVGLYLLFMSPGGNASKLALLVPITLYVVYSVRALPHLRVFKHTVRGYGYLSSGRLLEAAVSFRRALRIDPASRYAAQGLWDLHQRVDVTALPADAPLLRLLDYQFCLDQAEAILAGPQSPEARERAVRMLDLVDRQKPELAARVDYLRAVALAHARRHDEAAATVARLLDPETPYRGTARDVVLFPAWHLALRLHPELVKRLGEAELSKPGRRMEAIRAVERRLAAANDPAALELKGALYAGLTEAEFAAAASAGPPADFNYDHVEQLGLALADDADPGRRDRGMGYLRIAGRGLPERGPGIFRQLADLAEKVGDGDAARGYLEQVKRCGMQVGAKALAPDQREIYFAAVKRLADDAEARGDYEAAVADLRLYLENGKSELEGYRKLADLYEKNGDALNALLMVETALIYSGKDADLLARKDRYYYSVDPDRLRTVRDKVEGYFDADYCVRKARGVLDQKEADPELLDWAVHLARLARVMRPDGVAVRLVEARCLLRKGGRDAAVQLLEDLREVKQPGSGDEQEAWFQAARILGDLYLNEFDRPDLAVKCYLDFREYQRSGADTLFQIARCYEAMGDKANAIRFYEAVAAYDQHPKYWDATEAARRLKEEAGKA